MSYFCGSKDPGCISVCTVDLTQTENECLMCGASASFSTFQDNWTNGRCVGVLEKPYYVYGGGVTLAQQRADRVMEFMMGSDGSQLVTNGTDAVQNSLLQVCGGFLSQAPDACSNYITNILAPNGRYTYDQMAANPGVVNWLGCFLSPPADELPAYDSLSESVTPQVSCEAAGVGAYPCYPMCHRINTVQRYDARQTICNCNSNVCVIDNVSINAADNSSAGNINFLQMCPSCTNTNPCECIISSDNIEQNLTDNGLSYSINQYCGATNSVCYDIQNGTLVPVDCQTLSGSPNYPAWSVAVPVFVIVIGLFLFFIVLIVMFSTKEKRLVKYKEDPNEGVEQKEGENEGGSENDVQNEEDKV